MSKEFIEQLYQRLLGRQAEGEGVAFWVEELASGRRNAADITSEFLDSPEFAARVAPIARLYFAAFDRIPDADGLRFWVEQHQAGRSVESIAAAFADSEEFQSLFAAAEDGAFLQQVYQNVLKREPDEAGTAYLLGQLEAGMERAKLLLGFAYSEEFTAEKAEQIKVVLQYHGLVEQVPSIGDLAQALATDPIALITQLLASDAYSGVDVPGLSVDGVVVDGYISGATVFIDTDGDGVLDPNEVSVTTDSAGNFDFGDNADFGSLVMFGGTDIATGQAFEGRMTAPAGATVVNPLTTLVENLTRSGEVSAEAAVQQVNSALGIDAEVDLLNLDPIAAASDPNNSAADVEQALEVQKAAVQVNTLVSQTAALLAGSEDGVSESASAEVVYDALSSAIANSADEPGVVLDLSNTATIEQVVLTAVEVVDESAQAAVRDLASGAAEAITELNQAVAEIDASAGGAGGLIDIAAVQVVSEQLEEQLENAASTGDISDLLAAVEEGELQQRVEDAADEVGDIVQPPPAPEPEPEPTAPEPEPTPAPAPAPAPPVVVIPPNQVPEVAAALNAALSDDQGLVSIDLLETASDADGDQLAVAGLIEATGKTGWVQDGNTLQIVGTDFASLTAGETIELAFNYQVSDGEGGVVPQTLLVTITGTNSAPTVSAALNLSAPVSSVAQQFDLLAGASDVDDNSILQVVSIAETGGLGGWQLVGNQLQLDANAFSSLLAGQTQQLNFSYRIEDDFGGSVDQTATLTVDGSNNPPVVDAAVSRATDDGQGLVLVDLLAGASDADGDVLSVSELAEINNKSGWTPALPNIQVDTSQFAHLPAGETEQLQFTYVVRDPSGASVEQTAVVTIAGTNSPPTVNEVLTFQSPVSADEQSFDLLQGAADVDDGAVLQVAGLVEDSGLDGWQLLGNQLVLDANAYSELLAGENQVLNFSYQVKDGVGGSVDQTASLTVGGTNNPPVVSGPLSRTMNEGSGGLPYYLLGNVTEADGDTLSVIGLEEANGHGGWEIDGDYVRVDTNHYTSLTEGETLELEFSYWVADDNGAQVPHSAVVTIIGVNTAPVVDSTPQRYQESQGDIVIDLKTLISDPDGDDASLTQAYFGGPTFHTSSYSLDGDVLTINTDYFANQRGGSETELRFGFSYTDAGGAIGGGTVPVIIEGINSPPDVGDPIDITLSGNFFSRANNFLDGARDPEDYGNLTILNLTEANGETRWQLTGRDLIVDSRDYAALDDGDSITLEFSYDIADTDGLSVPQTATIRIEGTNDNPVDDGTVDQRTYFNLVEDDGVFTYDIPIGATDADANDVLEIVNITGSGAAADLDWSFDGTTFSLDLTQAELQPLYTGRDEGYVFSYQVSDGGPNSIFRVLDFTIDGVNDLPVAEPLELVFQESDSRPSAFSAIELDQGVTDVDWDQVSLFTIENLREIYGATGWFRNPSYNDNLEIEGSTWADFQKLSLGEEASLTFVYDVVDKNGGSAPRVLTITVVGEDTDPVVLADPFFSVRGGDEVQEFDLTKNIVEYDRLDTWTVGPVTGPSHAGIAITGNSLLVDPVEFAFMAPGTSQDYVFTYQVSDPTAG